MKGNKILERNCTLVLNVPQLIHMYIYIYTYIYIYIYIITYFLYVHFCRRTLIPAMINTSEMLESSQSNIDQHSVRYVWEGVETRARYACIAAATFNVGAVVVGGRRWKAFFYRIRYRK